MSLPDIQMKKTFLVCEFCDSESVGTLTLSSSEFHFCSVCGINRDNCKEFVANVQYIREERYNQHTCMDTCSHRTCGNYTTEFYEVRR